MKTDQTAFLQQLTAGDFRTVARALSLVENELPEGAELLRAIAPADVPVIGITGPPGAGKSTLVNALANAVSKQKKVAILAVDPTSPFNYGALLGDRIRMVQQFNNPNVFIRSVATRGALGGISERVIEMLDVLRTAGFDLVIIETVGVGQSEVDIAGVADRTVVVLVPESGDEIQNIKSGLMEVAQAFVVNKADRDGADIFANNLIKLLHQQHQEFPVFKTVAEKGTGVDALAEYLLSPGATKGIHRDQLMAEKAFKLIVQEKMRSVDKKKLRRDISEALKKKSFNIYRFVEKWLNRS